MTVVYQQQYQYQREAKHMNKHEQNDRNNNPFNPFNSPQANSIFVISDQPSG